MQIVEGIAIIDKAFSDDYCMKLISLFEDNPQFHFAGATMGGENHEQKNTEEISLADVMSLDEITNSLNDMLVEYLTKFAVDVPNWNLYNLFSVSTSYKFCKLQKYNKGKGHYKAVHQERDAQPRGKDRVFTFMFYLNTVLDGGQTNFPLQKMKISPKRGTLIIWPAGFPYLHNGEVPITHDKYIVTTWLEYNYGDENEK